MLLIPIVRKLLDMAYFTPDDTLKYQNVRESLLVRQTDLLTALKASIYRIALLRCLKSKIMPPAQKIIH